MALTITPVKTNGLAKHIIGDFDLRVFDVTFDNSYPDGGEPVTKANFGMETAIGFIPAFLAVKPGTGDQAFTGRWDPVAGTLQLFTADVNNAADGPLFELSAAGIAITDASTYVARIVVVGR